MNGKILITGGYGNLGSWITNYLANLGYELYILTRKEKNRFPNIKYNIIECDITNIDDLKNKLDFDLDFCIHMASYNEFFHDNYFKKALEVNTLGARNLLEVLSIKNIKNFIYFSTFHVYGASSGVINEESPLNPKNDYATTHLFSEYYIKQFGFTNNFKYTILRLTNSYGCPTFIDSDKWYLVLNDLTKSAYENQKIIIKTNGKVKRDFIYMEDVAKVIDQLLQIEATNEIYNLSSFKSYEIKELANYVKEVFYSKYNKNIEIKINKNDKTKYPNLNVDNSKLKNLIEFEPKVAFKKEINKIFELLEMEE
jgi:UDP-glucose 4-epimerase